MKSPTWWPPIFSLLLPIFSEHLPFGPIPWPDILLSLLLMTSLCTAMGHLLTSRKPLLLTKLLLKMCPMALRDEAFEEAKQELDVAPEDGLPRRQMRKRSGGELLFIAARNVFQGMFEWV